MSKRKTWTGRIYMGRDEQGRQQFYWVGRFATRRERDAAVAQVRAERPWAATPPEAMTCDEWADRYLERLHRLVERRERKRSTLETHTQNLKAFRREFGVRPINSVGPVEAEDWSHTVSVGTLAPVITVVNYAVRMGAVAHNPFSGLGRGRGPGRAALPPPTLDQLDAIHEACAVLGGYAQQMRDLFDFAALTLMRPGELYELRYADVDLAHNRVAVSRRLYRGVVDVPKTGKPKLIALVPPARDALLRQPTRTRDDGLVFVTRTGVRLSSSTLGPCWHLVRVAAGLDDTYDFYRCTKHRGVHELYRLGLSKRAIASQAGWSERDVENMLRVYGHADLVALAEVDELYRSDANVPQGVRDVP